MDVKYQIVVFGPGAARFGDPLKRQLRLRLKQLDSTLTKFVRFTGGRGAKRLDPKAPTVGVYFGGANPSTADVEAVRHLVHVAAAVLPVVRDTTHFRKQTPTELHGVNGIARDPHDPNLDAVSNLVLENLGLLRRSRRLFISYRRVDTSDVALQIRHELDGRGYDIFLDTHSVPKGDTFQEVLWQRLADSDIMILLDAPGFLESRWTREELAQAEALTVGVLQVVWPGRSPAPYSDLCERIYLDSRDLRPSGLRPQALARIAVAAERLRTRSLAARHENLVREFCDAAATVGARTSVQPQRYISVKLPGGGRIAAIPAVGVPDALRYHEASLRFSTRGRKPSRAFLIYDHRGLRPSWSSFLEWLDQFLPVKAVRVTTVADKLARL